MTLLFPCRWQAAGEELWASQGDLSQVSLVLFGCCCLPETPTFCDN